MRSPFIHLHTHSHYSLLSALPQIKALVDATKKNEMPALALTDNGNLYGAIEFYMACKKAGVKPIIGVDFYVASRGRHDKESGIDSKRTRLILLAKNDAGYKNLIKLVTYSHLEGFYYKPRVDDELLSRYKDGLIAIVPAFNSKITQPLKAKHFADAQKITSLYQEWYGKEHVYLEVTHHPEIEGHGTLTETTISFGKEHGIPIVATNDVHYLSPDDDAARRTLLSVQSGGEMRSQGGFTDAATDFSFTTGDEMYSRWENHPEAVEATSVINAMCDVTISLGTWMFPHIETRDGLSHGDELRRIVMEKIQEKNLPKTEEVQKRAEFELDTIITKGYAPYFLVVADLLAYAHEHGIFTNTRGSVAGSLVSYVLGITTVDPLEYRLPFERFLNPLRPSPPDIDLDIADDRRDELIAYARQKYGSDRVAQIGTFGTMLARGSVRDTARALGYDYATADAIAKLIPIGSQGFPMSIDRAMAQEPDLKKLYERDEDSARIIDMARKIEGCARHISVHAAGVVISPIPLDEVVPLQYDPKGEGKLITQYDMYTVEEVGLLKFDFLGLKNLAILADAVKRIKKIYDIDVPIDTLPLDDKKTYEMLARGETMGVFQLSGAAMTKFLIDLKPTNIYDINAMIALYRPGPMKNIPEYISRKHGAKAITYYHPKMRTFLERSYGILVYQDDLLETALQIAGYTWETVDKFRKAVGKKIPEEMAKQHDIFVAGCIEHSQTTKAEAEGLWNLFEPFQGYGFNKAHAASYGRVAYQTAYLKAHYPTAYMSAVLTADAGNIDEVAITISECKRMAIEVLPPDVNESFGDFSVVTADKIEDGKEKIRFGLHSIKNFGVGVGDAIITERKANGPYTTFEEFLSRVTDKNLNKKALEALIQAGALDRFGERGVMLTNIEEILSYHRHVSTDTGGQDSLFGGMTSTLPTLRMVNAPPATREEKLGWEKELLGLYISGHPLDAFKDFLTSTKTSIQKIGGMPPGLTTVVYGLIDTVRPIMTKKGDKMAFVTLSDTTGSIEVVAFPRILTESKDVFLTGRCVAIKGKISPRNGQVSIIADSIKIIPAEKKMPV
ncbi:MAG: DNA polymerase III subunit alpha [Patescibacteria group bacterium]